MITENQIKNELKTKFTVQDVVDAYRKIGYTPISCDYFGVGSDCCPLSALYLSLSIKGVTEFIDECTIIEWAQSFIGENNDTAFIAGVDNCDVPFDMTDEQREYYLLGQKCRAELNL